LDISILRKGLGLLWILSKDDWAKWTNSVDSAITLIFATLVLPTPTHASVDRFEVLKVLG